MLSLFLRLFKIINTLLTFNYREINFWKSHLYEYFRLTCTFTYLSRSNLRLSKNWQFVSRFRSRMKRESEETIVTGNCSKTESNFRSRRLMEIGRCAGSQDERFKVGGKNEFNGSSGLTRFQASGVPARFVRPFNLASRKYQPGGQRNRGMGREIMFACPFWPVFESRLPAFLAVHTDRPASADTPEFVICPSLDFQLSKREF